MPGHVTQRAEQQGSTQGWVWSVRDPGVRGKVEQKESTRCFFSPLQIHSVVRAEGGRGGSKG